MVGDQNMDDVSISSLEPFIQVKVPSILVRPHLPHLFAAEPLKKRQQSGWSLVDCGMAAGSSCVRSNAVIDLTNDVDIVDLTNDEI